MLGKYYKMMLEYQDQPAIIFNNKVVTYTRLVQDIDKIAQFYVHKQLSKVAILLDRSKELLVSLCAAIYSGVTYIIIDTSLPKDRIEYMLQDSEIEYLITQEEYSEIYSINNTYLIKDILCNTVSKEVMDTENVCFNEVAYINYTSGSSGKPKGVQITYMGLDNFIQGMSKVIDFNVGEKIICLTNTSFDIFFLESIFALYNGLTVVLANDDECKNPRLFSKLIEIHQVNLLQVTPSRLQLLIEYDKKLSCLKSIKQLLIGGENFSTALLKHVQDNYDGNIYNMYGPTETTIWSSVSDLTHKDEVDIGSPILETKMYIIDENHQQVTSGEQGEICITGRGLAKGYMNRESLTDEKFIYLPFNGERAYCTGDVGQCLQNGQFKFLGRLDNQVKINGYRIELEEIESVVVGYPGVSYAIAMPINLKDIISKIVLLYYGDYDNEQGEIRKYLVERLPEYMIPSRLIKIDMPYFTPNGKLDRKKIGEVYYDLLYSESQQVAVSQTSLSETMKTVLEILQSNMEQYEYSSILNENTTLVELGVNSIEYVKTIVAIEDTFNIEVSSEILNSRETITIGEIIYYIDNYKEEID